MKKILLISANSEKRPYPVPPLGICQLASVLEKNYDVLIYDAMFDSGRNIVQYIKENNPHYIGISIRNIDDMNYADPARYIENIREDIIKPVRSCSDVPLILGGSGFSILPVELMDYFSADFGVIGEGEETLAQLLKVLDDRGNPGEIPSVICSGDKSYSRSPHYFDFSSSAFSEIDLRLDFLPYRERGAYSIQTKRGCLHRCIYCTYNHIEGSAFRTRSPESIADEIEKAHDRLGQTTFEFVDSTFNDPPGHAEAICREIAGRGISVQLRTMGINPSHASRELFELMLAAGFTQVDCTPDSASAEILKSYGKNFSLRQLEITAGLISEYKIPTMWFFLFGGPGENRQTIDETLSFIDSHIYKYDMVHMTGGLRIYPHTPLYDIACNEGLISRDDSLLEPVFYISPGLGREKLTDIIKDISSDRPNCIPATESKPPLEMLKKAMEIQEEQEVKEPMFRTLLRLRYEMFDRKRDE